MAKARKTNGKAKAKAEHKPQANGARAQATQLVSRVQDGFREAGDALCKQQAALQRRLPRAQSRDHSQARGVAGSEIITQQIDRLLPLLRNIIAARLRVLRAVIIIRTV